VKVVTLDEMRQILVEELGVEPSEVTPEAHVYDLGADSLDAVQVAMVFEEKYDVEYGNDIPNGTVQEILNDLNERIRKLEAK
jgi:acyl carrier protein